MNVTDFFHQEGKREVLSLPFPITEYTDCEIINVSPLTLKIENIGKGKALVCGQAELKCTLPCDRCLQPVEVELKLDFTRELLAPEVLAESAGTEEGQDLLEDQTFLKDYELSIEELVEEELHLNWPGKVLCKEDCKGICQKCGKNLNQGDCDCEDFTPDIRFANLMDIFNAAQSKDEK